MPPVCRVTVEFMGPFEFAFGTAGAAVTLTAPATIATLLQDLAPQWTAAAELYAALAAGSARRAYWCVSLDYTMLAPEAVLETPLHDGARVCFGAPMAGG